MCGPNFRRLGLLCQPRLSSQFSPQQVSVHTARDTMESHQSTAPIDNFKIPRSLSTMLSQPDESPTPEEPLPVFPKPIFPPGFRYSRERVRLQSMPFLSNTIMSGPAGCKVEDFRRPRLRKCPFDLKSISWKDAKVLGYGVDGWVWRVNFGDRGPFALKLVSLIFGRIGQPHAHN